MKQNLYIDTNVYLTFFHFTSEDLEELKKLIALINTENIILYLPEQTKNEFYRNRESKISDSLDKLRTSKLVNQFPMICHTYGEYIEMQKSIKTYELNKSKLLEKLQHDAETGTLMADEILTQLFSKARLITTTPEILQSATNRYNMGNPPGKDKSYGDAINWISLLEKVPDKLDLYFISDDKDYYSKLNEYNFNDYLIKEWKEMKNSNIHYFKRLSEFLNKHYPNIILTSETEKEIIIKNLFEAYSYDNAKNVAKKLMQFDNFSVKQLNEITTAFSTNNQIYWIKTDYPIMSVRTSIIEANSDKIDAEIYVEYLLKFE